MEEENIEQEILLEPENAIVSPVTSVNGKIGAVVLTTSDLENDSDYQTGTEVQTAIDTAIAGKQDTLTAGANVQISDENVISATDTTYSAGNGINISGQNAISVDTTVVATQQNLSDEVTNRENADNYLQGQIDAISASSDVVDIVGTYAELQAYDTQHLKDNDIIKVLQDETQNNATTYYRWSTTTQSFTLIGQEGPYYTKASADAQFVPQTRTVNGKALSANITLNASDVSALGTSDIVQTTGSSTSQVMSQDAVTQALNTKLNSADYVVDTALANSTNPVQNAVLYGLLGTMPSDFFSGDALASAVTGTTLRIQNALSLDDMKMYGDTFQQTYSGKNLWSSAWGQGGIDGTTGENYSTNTEVRTVGYIAVEPNQHYAISRSIANGSVKVRCYDQNKQYLGTGSTYWIFISGDDGSASNPMKGSGTYCVIAPQAGVYYMRFTDTTNDTSTLYMMAKGDAAVPYEPYVGGQPSPSPDYPQNIDVVTGVQTVAVDDGGSNSQTYIIDLGSIELCKIGNYQDYIYKGSDGWYVHKEIKKRTFNGQESWGTATYGSVRFFYTTDAEGVELSDGDVVIISDKFLGQWGGANNTVVISNNPSTPHRLMFFTNDIGTTTNAWTTWLGTNNVLAYYALQTPTDTKITDQTLIGELEAVLGMTCYDGDTNVTITSTNLAGTLELTAVNANAKGLIYKARQ